MTLINQNFKILLDTLLEFSGVYRHNLIKYFKRDLLKYIFVKLTPFNPSTKNEKIVQLYNATLVQLVYSSGFSFVCTYGYKQSCCPIKV